MIILIDAVVGAGKSTLSEKIGEKLKIPVHYELQNQTTMNLLEEFYKDKNRWSFALQIHFLNERFKMIKEISKAGVGILDRSIFGDKIFAQMLNEDGYMTDDEYSTYSSLLDSMLEHIKTPDLLVYIDCDLETAMERIKGRGREMEQTTDSVYWGRLNEKYTRWYNGYKLSDKFSIGARSYHPDNEEDIDLIVSKIKFKLGIKDEDSNEMFGIPV
jgi:deoxyadenosine/deoxycytidine kinase